VKNPGGGNVSEIFLLPEYADKINASWRKATESILETARLCADANKDLKSKDREISLSINAKIIGFNRLLSQR
jgi:hypothetical protein